MSIGKNIALLRKNKGLTQAELGDLLGVSNQAVSKWESEMTMPDVMLLPEIAKVLGVEINDLYGPLENHSVEEASEETKHDETEDRRILNIVAQAEGANVKIRIPCKAVQSVLDCCLDEEDEELKSIVSILESDATGTLVDADTDECKVKIFVEEYDD